eukprot:507582_1
MVNEYKDSCQFKFRQFTIFILTFFGYGSYHACRQSFQDAKDDMTKNGDWDDTFSKDFEGVMNFIFLGTYALGMLFIGSQLGDKFDASTVHSCGLIFMAAVYFILGASIPLFNLDNTAFFCALWAVNGLVQSVGWPTGIKLMANWFDGAHDGMIFGIWTACQCTGNIIGSAYCDYVSAHNLDLQWNFWLPSMQAALMSILIFIFVPTYPRGMKPKQNHIQTQNLNNAQLSVPIKSPIIEEIKHNSNEGIGLCAALRLPNVFMYGVIFACIKGVNYTLFFWLPDFLENNSGFSDDKADQLSMYYNVGQIFGSLFCGFISDRFVKRGPTIFAFLCLSVTPIFMFRIPTHSYEYVAVLSSVAGFLMGGPSNLISSVMAAEIGKQQAESGNPAALSTLSGIVDGMGGVGAAICVFIATFIPVDSVFFILAVLVVASAILLLPMTIKDIKYILSTKNGRYPYDNDDIQDSLVAAPDQVEYIA